MNFELTEEQKQIKTLIKEFAEREVDVDHMTELAHQAGRARTAQEIRDNFPWDLIEKLHKVGLRELVAPEKYGGGGAGFAGHVTRAIAAEQAGYSMEVAGRLLSLQWFSIAAMDGSHVTEEQKDWFWTQYMKDHTMQVCTCASDPSGNTEWQVPYEPKDNPGAIGKVTARKEGKEWVINGEKMFSSASPVAKLMLVALRTDGGPVSKSQSCIWIPRDIPGHTQVVNRLIGGETVGNAQNNFDNVRVPLHHLVGEVNKGGLVFGDLKTAKMIAYVDIFGHGQKVYDGLVDYAKERIGGGRPIIQHTHIAQMLGELAIKMEATRSLIYRAAWENDQRQLAGAPADLFWSLSCFNYIRKVMWELCQIALEIYGGVGATVDMPVERFIRRVATWYVTGTVPSFNAIKCSMLRNQHTILQYNM